MDALSEVLGVIRLTGAVFLQMELCAQWSYRTAPARTIADVLMPEADHVSPYHLLMEGKCFARLLDGDFVELAAGDLVMFPAGDRHVLATASDASLTLEPSEISGESLSLLRRNEIVPFRVGESGDATRIVCGYLACDKRLAEPILRGLPRLLKLGMRDGTTAAWVHSSIRYSSRKALHRARARRWCSRVCPKCCSPKRSGSTWTRSRRTRRAGSPRCATATSAARSRCCTRNRRSRGRSTSSHTRWGCRGRRWDSASSR
jgi:hypothetical protein